MNNDLISREALKNEVDSWGCNDFDKYDFLEAIDNAPTVCNDNYAMGYQDGVKKVLSERPHGEWQLHGMIYYCSECGHECGESGDNFCGNCGADMGKEAENE